MTIQISTLENGLRVATDSIPYVETASIGMWVHAGARHEDVAHNGVAHFLEHMAFKGTKTRSAQQIAEAVEGRGGYLNAYTSREMTAYYARVLKEDVRVAGEILADILLNSTFDPQELQKERSVILQEIGQSLDTPDDVVFDHFQEVAFPNQALGRTILGPSQLIETIPREELITFMRTHYQPQHMVLAAAGNVRHEDVVEWANAYCGSFVQADVPPHEQGLYQGGDRREMRDLEQLHVVLGFQGVSYQGDESYVASLTSACLGGGMSSRLFQEVREKRGLVYSIYAFATSFEDTGVFGIYAGTGAREGEELLQVVLGEMETAVSTLSENELNRAKAQLKASLLMSYENTSNRAKKMAQNLLFYNRIISQDEVIQKIDQVSTRRVKDFITQLLKSPLTLASVGPTKYLPSYEAVTRYLG